MVVDDNLLAKWATLEGITVTINEQPVEKKAYSKPYSIEFEAMAGYEIIDIEGGGNYDPVNDVLTPSFSIWENYWWAEFKDNDYQFEDYTLIVEGGAVDPDPDPDPDPEPEPDVTISNEFIDNVNESGGDLVVNGVSVTETASFNYPLEVVINARSGYTFTRSMGVYDPIDDKYDSFTILNGGAKLVKTFTVNTPFYEGWQFESVFSVPEIRGFNNLFLIDDDDVKEIIDSAYGRFIGGENGTSSEYLDYRKYILGFIDLPFSLPSELIGENSSVKIANVDTNVTARIIKDDELEVNLGSISYQGEFNSYDYASKVFHLHLPYTDPVNIEHEYIFNETITVKYLISLIDGNCYINIYSSKIDGVIYTREINLNIAIPFRINETNPQSNEPSNIQLANKNELNCIKLEVLENKVLLPDGLFTIPIEDEGLLQGGLGYVEVDNILLSGVTGDVKRRIENQLKEGVIL